ncbi:MAG TPA: alpha/beta fold hydrolase [Vicinamibacterales bacterium]|jgi:hypothetical protein|nr:alpha/beta fold hydrolase [Vicinamibacterales bacterium]
MPLREIPGAVGVLEVLIDEPAASRGVTHEGLVENGGGEALRAAVVFAHPHPKMGGGGTMHTKVVYQGAKALARIGCAVLRFNFRGVGRSEGAFDNGVGEKDDMKAALDFMHNRYPGIPLWAAGMSFGSWVGLTAGAEDARVSALIGVAMPIRNYDFEKVRVSTTPKFFIHGERDEITSLRTMREFYAQAAEPKELAVVDGADHLFDGKVTDVADAIEDLLGDWP